MLGQDFGDLPPLEAALVEFAQTLTARPWTVGPAYIQRLFAVGLSREAIALVIGLIAMFNYLTRVADGTGIEADYGGELPTFVYRGLTESVPRPGRAEWPVVDASIQLSSLLPGVEETWSRWREYVMESSEPISMQTRSQLRAIAARNACDSSVASTDQGADETLAAFADKHSRTPWLVSGSDVDGLRELGLDDVSILHVIAVVAYQSAESRLRIGLSALARCDG